MNMELKEALNKLKNNKEFKQWKKNNANTFFSYAFKILKEERFNGWQLGFYNKSNDKITTFSVNEVKIEINQEEDVFKKPDMAVKEINTEKLKLPLKKILEKIEVFKKKNYPKETGEKIIVILQNLDSFGNIWNITYITKTFNTLNMKVDAENGKILQHKLSSIFAFKKE